MSNRISLAPIDDQLLFRQCLTIAHVPKGASAADLLAAVRATAAGSTFMSHLSAI